MTKISPVHSVIDDNAFLQLPEIVQHVHDNNGYVRMEGYSDVERGGGIIGDFVCWMAGLPRHGHGQKTVVEFTLDDNGVSHWSRNFEGRVYSSSMTKGEGGHAGKLVEQLSVWTGVFELSPYPDRLAWTLTELRMFGIKLPPLLTLECHAFEAERDGRYHFLIHMDIPLIGHLICYKGNLDVVVNEKAPPSEATPSAATS
jgi:hypothetical protein